jgi:type I restriction enzyme S subunit
MSIDMEEWKEYLVEDLIDEIAMGPFGSNIKVDNFVDSGIPVLNGSNLQGFKLNEDSFNYVTETKADQLGKANAYRGDVVITHRGTLGQIVYIPKDSKYDRYVISQSQFRLKLKEEMVRPDFFVYFFHTRIGQYRLLMNKSQVGVPALARPTSSFKSVLVPVPSREIQDHIMSILSSLDSKIELNRKINENLEQQAQAIFKSWFIDFEPFKDGKFVETELGMIPEGWKVNSLTDIADFQNGLAMQKYPPLSDDDSIPVLKIKELGQSYCDSNSDRCTKNLKPEFIVHDGDVVFSWSGTLLVDLWCGGICGLNQHLFKVTSSQYSKWFYLMWTKHHLAEFIRIAKDKAVTMGHIKRGDLDKAFVLIPDDSTFERISPLMNVIIDKIISLRLESARLATLRDTLLPKLMSGQITL